jgi:hypothetical protein
MSNPWLGVYWFNKQNSLFELKAENSKWRN